MSIGKSWIIRSQLSPLSNALEHSSLLEFAWNDSAVNGLLNTHFSLSLSLTGTTQHNRNGDMSSS